MGWIIEEDEMKKIFGIFISSIIIGLSLSTSLKAQTLKNEVLVLVSTNPYDRHVIHFFHDQNGFTIQYDGESRSSRIDSRTHLYAGYEWTLIKQVATMAGVNLKSVYTVTFLGGHSGWYIFCDKNNMVLGDAIYSSSPDYDNFQKYKVLSKDNPLPISNP